MDWDPFNHYRSIAQMRQFKGTKYTCEVLKTSQVSSSLFDESRHSGYSVIMTSRLQSSSTRLDGFWLAALVLVFLPSLLWLGEAWLSDPYYSHGPLVLLVAIYLAWNTRRALVNRAPSAWGLALVALALAGHLTALTWRAFYLSALMLPLALTGLVVTLFGWHAARRLAFPLAFLILMVPLPLAERLGPVLEGWSASGATFVAQAAGVAAANTGAQMTLPNSTYAVDIPWVGLHSIIAIITLAALLMHTVRGAAWARGAIFIAAIPVTLAANTALLALLFAAASIWGAQAMLYYNAWSSPVLVAAAFALLVLLARTLRCSQVRWEVVFPQ